MKSIDEYVRNLYLADEYIIRNPSLHQEDSHWKIRKIIPLVGKSIYHINKDEINLLDVGGGSGSILNAVSMYIEASHRVKVNKFAVDLSSEMLEIQKKMNLDLRRALNEDIRKTSLSNKKIDLTLMIDVLEHVPNPEEALEEVKRISNFVIFKVPLEDNLHFRIFNLVDKSKPRKDRLETIGHINIYNFNKLRHQIEKHTGNVIDFYFTNVFDYYRNSEIFRKWGRRAKLTNFVSAYTFRLSPKLCSIMFTDYVMILVECY